MLKTFGFVFISLTCVSNGQLFETRTANYDDCPNKQKDFNRKLVYEQLTQCKLEDEVDEFREADFGNEKVAECAFDLNIHPINLFSNIERELVKDSKALQMLSTCLKQALTDEFLDAFYHYDMTSYCLDDICRYNYRFIYPLFCFGRQHCDSTVNDYFFALIYARQQLRLEMNGPLKCGPNLDVNPELFKPYTTPVEVFDENACQNIEELLTHRRVKRNSTL